MQCTPRIERHPRDSRPGAGTLPAFGHPAGRSLDAPRDCHHKLPIRRSTGCRFGKIPLAFRCVRYATCVPFPDRRALGRGYRTDPSCGSSRSSGWGAFNRRVADPDSAGAAAAPEASRFARCRDFVAGTRNRCRSLRPGTTCAVVAIFPTQPPLRGIEPMKLKTNKMSSAVRLALSLGAVMAAGISVSAFAQDAAGQSGQGDQTQATQLKAVVVTGSNIRRVDVETSSPVFSVDRTVIEASGNVTLGDLVQDLPAMTGANTNAQNSSNGTSTVNLRGLGPDRTLILVDGHRVQSQDVNVIPAAMIERIDVLTTGASSVYGSDAVGGVVNFITKKDFQGVQA